MTGALRRWKRTALRPLWAEGTEYRTRRRCRALIALPFAALAGLTWGVLAAPALEGGSGLFWGVFGAFSFAFATYVEQRLVPGIWTLGEALRNGMGGVAVTASEVGVIGGLFYLLTSVLGAPVVPAVATALGVGAAYAVLVEYVVCGSAASGIARLVQGTTGAWPRSAPGTSFAEALVQQGRFEEAVGFFERFLAERPRDGGAYARLARLQLQRGDACDAVNTLLRGLGRADLDAEQDRYFIWLICEVCTNGRLDPRRGAEVLHALLEGDSAGPHAPALERALAEIGDGLAGPSPVTDQS